jgi:hypothetical protein
MTKSAHTPGPWYQVAEEGEFIIYHDVGDRAYPIATVNSATDGVFDEGQGNANLFLAAPKLLAALHRLTTVIALNDALLNTISSDDYESALYAIAEAEGVEV